MSTLTSHLVTRDPDQASAWYVSVLGATETFGAQAAAD
jgi:hypothetical protein